MTMSARERELDSSPGARVVRYGALMPKREERGRGGSAGNALLLQHPSCANGEGLAGHSRASCESIWTPRGFHLLLVLSNAPNFRRGGLGGARDGDLSLTSQPVRGTISTTGQCDSQSSHSCAAYRKISRQGELDNIRRHGRPHMWLSTSGKAAPVSTLDGLADVPGL